MKTIFVLLLFSATSYFFQACEQESQAKIEKCFESPNCKGDKSMQVTVSQQICGQSSGIWGRLWLKMENPITNGQEIVSYLEPSLICEGVKNYSPKEGDKLEIKFNVTTERIVNQDSNSVMCLIYVPSIPVQITSIKVLNNND